MKGNCNDCEKAFVLYRTEEIVDKGFKEKKNRTRQTGC